MRNDQTPDSSTSQVSDAGRRSFSQEGRVDTTDEAWQRGMTPMSVLRYEEDVSDAPTVISGGPDELPDLSDLFPSAKKRPGVRATYSPPTADEGSDAEAAPVEDEPVAEAAAPVPAEAPVAPAPEPAAEPALPAAEGAARAEAPVAPAAEGAARAEAPVAPAEAPAAAGGAEAGQGEAASVEQEPVAAAAPGGGLVDRWPIFAVGLLVGAGLVSFLVAFALILLMS